MLDTKYNSSLTSQDLYDMLCKHEVLVFRDYTKIHSVPEDTFELFRDGVLGNNLSFLKTNY